jgi:large subunit ribosomal protein L3
MASGLIARKVGMSQLFLESGEVVPVTYLKVEPNTVIRLKTAERDGYSAVVLGIGHSVLKTRKGKEHPRYAIEKEWRTESLEGLSPGATLTAESIPERSLVTVTGTSKGKGFQGVVKRYGFAGGPRTHGSHFQREPGSVGMREKPGRILKGKRMPGHMGHQTVTLRHRPVVACDPAEGMIAIKGPVPGPNGSIVYLTLEAPSA